jgi:hypothetical protein
LTGPDPHAPGVARVVWHGGRWVLLACVLSTLVFAASLPHQPLHDSSPSWARHAAGLGVSFMRITAVLAVFLPMLSAVRFGRWALSPITRSMLFLTLAGWGAVGAMYAAFVVGWAAATRP